MSRKKTSPVWLAKTDEEFILLVNNSNHIGDVLRAFQLENIGRNHCTARARIELLKIDTSHFDPRKKRLPVTKRPLDDWLINGSTIKSTHLKHRLLRYKYIENKCSICNLLPLWNNIKLVMILDHINGNRHDNRLENLRLLCPNCNSQQDTFAGKRKKYIPE